MVYKRPPYAPDATGFGADDARSSRRDGFTTVRLGLIWKAVEPRAGEYDDAYLDRIAQTVEVLHRTGSSRCSTSTRTSTTSASRARVRPTGRCRTTASRRSRSSGFPGNYFAMTAMWRAYDHFWANDPGPGGVGLQDRYAAAWAHVAERFGARRASRATTSSTSRSPGPQWETCLNAGRLPGLGRDAAGVLAARDRRDPEPSTRRRSSTTSRTCSSTTASPTYVRPRATVSGCRSTTTAGPPRSPTSTAWSATSSTAARSTTPTHRWPPKT